MKRTDQAQHTPLYPDGKALPGRASASLFDHQRKAVNSMFLATVRVALHIKAATMAHATVQAELLHTTAEAMPHWSITAVLCDIRAGASRPARADEEQ